MTIFGIFEISRIRGKKQKLRSPDPKVNHKQSEVHLDLDERNRAVFLKFVSE